MLYGKYNFLASDRFSRCRASFIGRFIGKDFSIGAAEVGGLENQNQVRKDHNGASRPVLYFQEYLGEDGPVS